MNITKCKQHFIDWDSVGGQEVFLESFRNAPAEQKDLIIDSLPLQTNQEWLKARRGHITGSNAKKFLGFAPNKKDIGAGFYDVMRDYIAENDGGAITGDDMANSWADKAAVKQGLLFEARAIELFEQATGIKLKTDSGFVSNEISGLKIGCSLDAYADDENGKITIIAEVKSFNRSRQIKERENAAKESSVSDQMQWNMMTCDNAKVAYKILYNRYNDTIQYIKWTRGLLFSKAVVDRVPDALNYIEKVKNDDTKTDLTEM